MPRLETVHEEETRLAPPSAGTLGEAARLLAEGRLVAFPTETVYGLGADARNALAVARLYEAKGRPRFNPLIVHVASRGEAEELAAFDARASRLADMFWPGPLTLVLPRREPSPIAELATAGLATVALRVPASTVAGALLVEFGGPVAAPSANPSGALSPTRAEHVREGLFGKVALILDGGPCEAGIESTIVGFARGEPRLLRPGALPRAAIEAAIGPLGAAGGGISAPGQLESHYAPRAPLRLGARDVRPGEALLAFGHEVPEGAALTLNLSDHGDLVDAAASLFGHLRALDAAVAAGRARSIAVMPIPEDGLGEAINDRLARAAAPRS
ncbi:MAG: threonylcarbamoyl-AMP synthase [Alphaproteobacteria bacterium]|nr:threonylcarbamoyl-AMP synthase [Alphaproteobacteria bacterium]